MDAALEKKILASFAPVEEPAPVVDPVEVVVEPKDPVEGTEKTKGDEPKLDSEGKPLPKTDGFDRKEFYKKVFEQEFEDDDKAVEYHRSLKEKAAKAEEHVSELDKVRKRNEELEKSVDPLQFFDSEEELTKHQLLRAFKKEFPAYDQKLLSDVVLGDLKDVDPIDILAMQYRMKDPDIYKTDEAALEDLYEDFGFDPNLPFDKHNEKIQRKILKAAKEARLEFDNIKSKVKPEALMGPAAKREAEQKLRTERIEKLGPGWKQSMDAIPSLIKNVTFDVPVKEGEKESVETIEFSFEPEFISIIEKDLPKAIEAVAANGVEITKANEEAIIGGVVNKAFSEYFGNKNNIVKLLTKQRNELISKWNEQQAAADAGVEHPSGKERPNSQKQADKASAEVKAMKDYLDKKNSGK